MIYFHKIRIQQFILIQGIDLKPVLPLQPPHRGRTQAVFTCVFKHENHLCTPICALYLRKVLCISRLLIFTTAFAQSPSDVETP